MRKLLLKPTEVATLLNISVRTLANRRALGLEPVYQQDQKGSSVRYPADGVENYINKTIRNNSKFKRSKKS